MKGNDTKVKSLFLFILMLVIIAGTSFIAVKACLSIGKDDQTMTTQAAKQAESDSKTEDAAKEEPKKDATIKEDASKEEDKEEENKQQDTAVKQNKIRLGLDLQGGVNIVYEAIVDGEPSEDDMRAALQMIQLRLDKENYTEAEAYLEGSNRIRVDIPGVKDPQKAIEDIGATAYLKFTDEKGNEVLSGKNVTSAQVAANTSTGITKIVVSLEFDAEGKEKFAKATTENVGKPLLIFLDDTLISYPTVNVPITDGKAVIEGNFTQEEAEKLAERIEAGSLPFALKPVSSQAIGAKLGMGALETSMKAGALGFILILVFMIAIYRVCGVAADIALTLYIGIVILILSGMEATLTLPGIAGIILSVGMAVDANIIIFVRIKEELAAGRSTRAAVDAGFKKAFSAILDGNVTTLIASLVLYLLGTGLIKSFATTLGIGILVSMFTALVITRILLKCFVNMGIKNPAIYGAVKKSE